MQPYLTDAALQTSTALPASTTAVTGAATDFLGMNIQVEITGISK